MANLLGVKKVFNIRTFIFILLFIAFTFIMVDVTKMYYKCPPNKIEYRYIPRSFNDEQDNPVPLKSIFGKMFSNPSPWVNSFTEAPDIQLSNIRQN
tara:strand:+ start:400 stop:687 length:288 start_codon:yes stop_codon:yes gene_type:complete